MSSPPPLPCTHLWQFRGNYDDFRLSEFHGVRAAVLGAACAAGGDICAAAAECGEPLRVSPDDEVFYLTRDLTDEQATRIAARCLLLHAVYRLWARGSSHGECLRSLLGLVGAADDGQRDEPGDGEHGALACRVDLPSESSTFKCVHCAYGRKVSQRAQVATYSYYSPFLQRVPARIDLERAEHRVCILEDYAHAVVACAAGLTAEQMHGDAASARSASAAQQQRRQHDESENEKSAAVAAAESTLFHRPRQVFVAEWLRDGAAHLGHQYSLKRRSFIGTTSMDAELAFIMANVGAVRDGAVVLDPYVGTGSIPVSCAVFGAGVILGADLDMRVLKPRAWCPWRRGSKASIETNFAEYGIPRARWPDLLRVDMTQRAFIAPAAKSARASNGGGWCDAVICDPPYGIRESSRCAYLAPTPSASASASTTRSPALAPSNKQGSRRVQLNDQLAALISLAANVLVVGGRLVYWLPTTAAFAEHDLPRHDAMRHAGRACCQPMSRRLHRRLVTMVKVREVAPARDEVYFELPYDGYVPEHVNLAAKYFGVASRRENDLPQQQRQWRRREDDVV